MAVVRFLAGVRIYFFAQCPDRFWSSSNLIFNGFLRYFPRVKRPGFEANHTPPSSVEMKNGGAIPPLPNTSSRRGA
jgi:hypothetical protein